MKPNILFLACLLPLQALAASTDAGKVILSIGSNQAEHPEMDTRELLRASPLFAQDSLLTGDKSRIQARMLDGGMISLRPNTEFKIAEYSFETQDDNVVMELIKGGMRTVTGQIGRDNHDEYTVKTAIATIGIRGTHYALQLCDQLCATVRNGRQGLTGQVITGAISVEGKADSKTINAGEYFFLEDTSGAKIEVFRVAPVEFIFDESQISLSALSPSPELKTTAEQMDTRNIRSVFLEETPGTPMSTARLLSDMTPQSRSFEQPAPAVEINEGSIDSLLRTEDPVIIEEPTPTEDPVVTEDPTPTEDPVVTEDPMPTEDPVVAVAPAIPQVFDGVTIDGTAIQLAVSVTDTTDGTVYPVIGGIGGEFGYQYVAGTMDATIDSLDDVTFVDCADTSACLHQWGLAFIFDVQGTQAAQAQWGRWIDDDLAQTIDTPRYAQIVDYMFSNTLTSAETALARTGLVTYLMAEGPGPITENGLIGNLAQSSGQIAIDYGTSNITAVTLDLQGFSDQRSISLSLAQESPVSTFISGGSLGLNGSCVGGACGSAGASMSGVMAGQLIGPAGEAIMSSYGASADQQNVSVSGTALFIESGISHQVYSDTDIFTVNQGLNNN